MYGPRHSGPKARAIGKWCVNGSSNVPDYEGFWGKIARDNLIWHKQFTKVLNESNAPFYTWFEDGELNVSYNCLDRHLEHQAGQDRDHLRGRRRQVTKITYKELYHRVCRFANGLKRRHHQGRPRPHLHADVDRGGGGHAGLRPHRRHAFGGVRRLLGQELQERIIDAKARLVITADGQYRGGKEMALKPAVDEALGMGGCELHREGRRLQAHRRRGAWNGAATSGGTTSRRDCPTTCEPTHGSAPSIRCSSSTPPARPASPRACSTPRGLPAGRDAEHEVDLRHQARRRLLVHRRRRLGHRPHLRRLRPARGGRHRGDLRGRADLSRTPAASGA
jgi:hypothetical protein